MIYIFHQIGPHDPVLSTERYPLGSVRGSLKTFLVMVEMTNIDIFKFYGFLITTATIYLFPGVLYSFPHFL